MNKTCNIFGDKIGLFSFDWIMNFIYFIIIHKCLLIEWLINTIFFWKTSSVSYREKLSNQHIRGFFWDIPHKDCCGGPTGLTFFGSNKFLIMDGGLTDHWHRRDQYRGGRGHDAHVNWDHWSSCKNNSKIVLQTFHLIAYNGAVMEIKLACWEAGILGRYPGRGQQRPV